MWTPCFDFITVISFILVSFTCHLHVLCENNYNFSSSIRDFSHDENENISEVRTLQKHENKSLYNKYVRFENPIRNKDNPDSSVSSTSYSRGFAHQDNSGYGFNGFDLGPYEGGQFEHFHHNEHEPHYYLDHGHHHKLHDHHALAVKTFLWPLAGIALLGAAAALVTNPVLLQLGVISGRKKRSTILETTTRPTIDVTKYSTTENVNVLHKYEDYPLENRRNFNDNYLKRFKVNYNSISTTSKYVENNPTDNPSLSRKRWDDKSFIPVPLKLNRRKLKDLN